MAVAKLFRSFPGVGSSDNARYGSVAVITANDANRRLEVLDDFEHAGIGWLWATDAEFRLIYISENAAEKLSRPIEEL
ncbi:MAG TPA: GGDEF domain-containing protein, partial [Sphingorhabdus lacus]|nr:GGDEF domain-containing protein [Sphingorhabdus lacus]